MSDEDSRPMSPLRHKISDLRYLVVDLVVDVLTVLVLVALVLGVAGVATDLWSAIVGSRADAFKEITVQVLTVFIFIEIFHSLVEYLKHHRVRITHLVDATLAFVLREVWVKLYGAEVGWQEIAAMAALVIALGGVRTLAVVFSPGEREALESE